MMGHQTRSESLFYYFRLEDQIPEDHLLRLIDQHIDLSFVRERLKSFYSSMGRPSIARRAWLRRQSRRGRKGRWRCCRAHSPCRPCCRSCDKPPATPRAFSWLQRDHPHFQPRWRDSPTKPPLRSRSRFRGTFGGLAHSSFVHPHGRHVPEAGFQDSAAPWRRLHGRRWL